MTVITIDGPAASGKNTVAIKVASALNYFFLPTGNIYRSLAKKVIDQEVSWSDIPEIVKLTSTIKFEDLNDPSLARDQIAKVASRIATTIEVREALLVFQRNFASRNLLAEGRDMGTVVFPDAELKIFITATQEIRAERRFKDLLKSDPKISYELILNDLKKRDEIDRKRQVSPLKAADDAIIIDTSKLTIAEVTEQILKLAKIKGLTV